MGSLPSLRVSGRKVWSRIRQGGLDGLDVGLRAIDGLHRDLDLDRLSGLRRLSALEGFARARKRAGLAQALVVHAQQVVEARSPQERVAQLARVLDTVAALADAHGIADAELSARRQYAGARNSTGRGLRQRLRQRASGVAAHVWLSGRASRDQPLSVAVAATSRRVSPQQQPAERVARAPEHKTHVVPSRRARAFPLRIGRARAAAPAVSVGTRLVAASLLHMPRLHRQLMAVRRASDIARSTLSLVRAPARPLAAENVAAVAVLLSSGRSGLQLTYRLASVGAQRWLRRYVLPRVLRYVADAAASPEVVVARSLPPVR